MCNKAVAALGPIPAPNSPSQRPLHSSAASMSQHRPTLRLTVLLSMIAATSAQSCSTPGLDPACTLGSVPICLDGACVYTACNAGLEAVEAFGLGDLFAGSPLLYLCSTCLPASQSSSRIDDDRRCRLMLLTIRGSAWRRWQEEKEQLMELRSPRRYATTSHAAKGGSATGRPKGVDWKKGVSILVEWRDREGKDDQTKCIMIPVWTGLQSRGSVEGVRVSSREGGGAAAKQQEQESKQGDSQPSGS
jgi:hypothetical protein